MEIYLENRAVKTNFFCDSSLENLFVANNLNQGYVIKVLENPVVVLQETYPTPVNNYALSGTYPVSVEVISVTTGVEEFGPPVNLNSLLRGSVFLKDDRPFVHLGNLVFVNLSGRGETYRYTEDAIVHPAKLTSARVATL